MISKLLKGMMREIKDVVTIDSFSKNYLNSWNNIPFQREIWFTIIQNGSFKATFVSIIRYGPREVMKKEEFSMKGQLTCEFKFATFSCRVRRQYQQDNEEKDYSSQLQDALEPAVCLVDLAYLIMSSQKYLFNDIFNITLFWILSAMVAWEFMFQKMIHANGRYTLKFWK